MTLSCFVLCLNCLNVLLQGIEGVVYTRDLPFVESNAQTTSYPIPRPYRIAPHFRQLQDQRGRTRGEDERVLGGV